MKEKIEKSQRSKSKKQSVLGEEQGHDMGKKKSEKQVNAFADDDIADEVEQ